MSPDLILRTFRNSKGFSLLFVLNFCLGTAGIFALDDFKGAMNASLEEQSRAFLGADLVVSSRFPITAAVERRARAFLPPVDAVYEGLSMSSMAASKRRSRLVQVVQVGEGFPFFGGFRFAEGGSYPGGAVPLPATDGVWVYPEIPAQLELGEDEPLKVGQAAFTVERVVAEDAYKAIRFSGFVPRVYMTAAAIERAGLVQRGTTARYSLNVKLAETFGIDELERIENALEDRLGESVHVRSPEDGSDRVTRILQIVTDFLALVSLVTLFLSLVGLVYLYSGFLLNFRRDMGILLELGMRRSRVIATYLGHFLALVSIGAALVFGLVAALRPWAESVLAAQVGGDLVFRTDPWFFVRGLGFVLLVTPAVAWPMLAQSLSDSRRFGLRQAAAYLPLLALLLGLSVYVSGDEELGLYFCLAVAGLVAVSLAAGWGVLKLADRHGLGRFIAGSLAHKAVTRKPAFSLTVGVALFFATGLFSLIPQVGGSLIHTLSVAEQDRPRLFLVDIQERQLDGLRELAAERGTELANVAPILRARIKSHNGEEFAPLDPDDPANAGASESELRDRAVNLSYRDELYDSESIVAGRPFSGRYDDPDLAEPVELSVEQRYADRRGIELGDRLTFDVLGMPVSASVVNLRAVKWTDFLPNFFLLFQDGALNDAPKSYLATIPPGDYDADEVIMALAGEYPTVSVIDVKYVIDSILKLVRTTSDVLYRMGAIAVAIGLLIIVIIIQHQMVLRQADILRLKMIGVKLGQIRAAFLLEFAGLATTATALGLACAAAGAWSLSRYLFEEPWVPGWGQIVATGLGVPLLVVAIVAAVSWAVTVRRETSLFAEE